jgi:drug/metabolite transporter, DME family
LTADRRPPRLVGAQLVVAAAVLWGTTGTARDLGPDGASPVAVGALRVVLGGALLYVVARRAGFRFDRRRWPTGPLAVAIVTIAAYQPLFFAGVSRAGVAVGTVVGIGSSPIVGGLLGRLLRHERLGWQWLAATTLGIGGAALLAGAGDAGDDVATGLFLAVGAGCSYAVYVVASATLLDHHPPRDVGGVVMGGAGVLLVPVALIGGIGWLGEADGLAMAAWLAGPTMLVAYPLMARGLREVGVGATATLTLAEPATAAVLGLLVLGERLEPAGWVGLVLVAAGVVVEATRRRSSPRHSTSAGAA